MQSKFADQAIIQPHGKRFLVVSGALSQHDVDQYIWCFTSSEVGKWIQENETAPGSVITAADTGLDVPQIRVSPGLSQTSSDGRIRYALIFQGISGANKAKLMIADTLDQAAVIMLHEALNGFSTVFSAAYLPQPTNPYSVRSVGPTDASFTKASALSDLTTTALEDVLVNLLC